MNFRYPALVALIIYALESGHPNWAIFAAVVMVLV